MMSVRVGSRSSINSRSDVGRGSNEQKVGFDFKLLSIQPQLSGEMNENLRQLVGQLVYSSSVTMTADQDQHE